MKSLLQDVRYGLRMLRKSPGFTAVAIITLALGIGANTAIFSLINAIMLRTLPVRDPQSLVFVTWAAKRPPHADQGEYMWGGCVAPPATSCSFSFPIFEQFHSQQQVFSGLFGYLPANVAVNAYGHASHVLGLYVSGDFFPTLGTQALLGRPLTPSDDSRAANPAIVVSSRFWQNVLGGDRAAIGKSILIGKAQFTIVGVVRPIELDLGIPRDFWLPLSFQSSVEPGLPKTTASNAIWVQLMARLKPGISVAQAASAMSAMFAASTTHGPEAIFAPRDQPRIELPTAAHGLASLRDSFSQSLFAIFAAVALVLLIACANIAGIMLARSTARRKEIAMRSALGATRIRIMRQLLTESLLLATAGGAVGILLGYGGAASLARFLTRNWYMPMQVDVHPDLHVLAFTALAAFGVGLLFGVVPAFLSGHVDLVPALKEGARGGGSMHGKHFTVGNALVVLQVSLAVLVLVGTGLLVRTLLNLKAVNPGFDPQNLLVFGVDTTYANRTGLELRIFNRELQERLASLPGVTSVSFSEVPLLAGGGIQGDLYPENETQSLLLADYLPVAPKFFETMRIPLLAGRTLNAQDSEQTPSHKATYQPVVINENLAHRLFGNQNPIGRHFHAGTPSAPLSEVVGVVGDAKYDALRANVMPTLYAPIGNDGAAFEIRTAMDPKTLMAAIRAAVSRFDNHLLITDMKTQMEQIDQNIYPERLIANLSSLFALLALGVACVGIYGSLSYQVTRRTQEIGIRLALGAQREDVLRIVLRQGAVLAILGAAIGVAAALALTRYLQSFLFGVKPSDPATIIAVALGLIAVALLASYIPARRAMKTDPMVALRYE